MKVDKRTKQEKARDTMLARYGKDFFSKISRQAKKPRGGKHTKGSFNSETARKYGALSWHMQKDRKPAKMVRKMAGRAINLNADFGNTDIVDEVS